MFDKMKSECPRCGYCADDADAKEPMELEVDDSDDTSDDPMAAKRGVLQKLFKFLDEHDAGEIGKSKKGTVDVVIADDADGEDDDKAEALRRLLGGR